MPNLSQAKTLGEVGLILMILTAVPTIGVRLGFAGFILILLAVKDISDIAADKTIYRNMLTAVGFAVAGLAVGALIVAGTAINFFRSNGLMGSNLSGFRPSSIPPGQWAGLIVPVLAGLAVVWVMLLVSSIYVRRSYSSIASKLHVDMFGRAGFVYLIGAATTIVLVGFVILFAAQVLLAVAFFYIDEKALEPPAQTAPVASQ